MQWSRYSDVAARAAPAHALVYAPPVARQRARTGEAEDDSDDDDELGEMRGFGREGQVNPPWIYS